MPIRALGIKQLTKVMNTGLHNYLFSVLHLSLPFLLPPFWYIGHPWNALLHFSFVIIRQSVGLLGRGISPSQGRYLHMEQHKHRINAHNTDVHALSVIRTHDPSIRVIEDISCLRPRGHIFITILDIRYSTAVRHNGQLFTTLASWIFNKRFLMDVTVSSTFL
jgi:hypothetical protein